LPGVRHGDVVKGRDSSHRRRCNSKAH
jgi:hypothetical protein